MPDNKNGQSIVELALTLPILLGLVLLGIEGGWVYLSYQSLSFNCDQASVALAHGDNPAPLIHSQAVDALGYTLAITNGVVTDFDCQQILDSPELDKSCLSQSELLALLDNPSDANLAIVDCHKQHQALTGFYGQSVYMHHGGISAR